MFMTRNIEKLRHSMRQLLGALKNMKFQWTINSKMRFEEIMENMSKILTN